jgi:hypothetical protein
VKSQQGFGALFVAAGFSTSCPALCRASTSLVAAKKEDVDGRA